MIIIESNLKNRPPFHLNKNSISYRIINNFIQLFSSVYINSFCNTYCRYVQKAAISKHLKNIFISEELDRTTTVSKMETVQREGCRSVNRRIEYFNLDAVISAGYRVNSVRATRFHQWATRTLRQHLTQGYTLNRQRLEANAQELETALLLVRKAVQNPDLRIDAGRGLVEHEHAEPQRCILNVHLAKQQRIS